MPLILSPDPGGVTLIEREATFTSAALATITRTAAFDTRLIITLERSVTFVASGPGAVVRQVAWTGQANVALVERYVTWPESRLARIERTVTFGGPVDWPVVQRRGPAQLTSVFSSSAGQVIGAHYTHSGTRESLDLTVIGVATPHEQLTLSISQVQGGAQVGVFAVALDGDLSQYEVRTTPTGSVTTLHGENRAAARLGSVRLPELIPWKRSPTPKPDRRVPCGDRLKPQSTSVSGIIAEAFQAAGMSLNYPRGNPFSGETWKEGEREYSTLGKTPDQVFADSLGQLGYTYVVRGRAASALPPGAGYPEGHALPEDLMGDLTVRGEAGNVPSLVTLTGADLLLDKPNIIDLLGAAPDADSLTRELLRDVEWYVTTPTSAGETIKGFRKAAGQITDTAELTLGSVTVSETVDNVLRSRTFDRVVTGFTSTQSTHDPLCPDAMTMQRTVKQSYGYTLNTDTHSGIFSGPGFVGGYEAGDTLGDEEQTIYQTYSPEGYLNSRTTITRKLATLTQQGADGPAADRGPLLAREYLTQTLGEVFQPVGGGQWLRLWNVSGGQQLPLYDQQSGDAVGLATRGGVFTSGQDVMDAAPPQVRCPDPCAAQKVAYPQVLRSAPPKGREGQEISRSLPMIQSSQKLASYLDQIVASVGSVLSTDATLTYLRDWRPGTLLTGALDGVVQTLTLDAAAGMATAKMNVRRLLELRGDDAPPPMEGGVYRDQALWRLPGGIVVNHLREIKDGEPKFTRIFVRATGANLPAPGDEVEWRDDTRFGPTATGNYGG